MFEASFRSKLQYLTSNQQLNASDELHETTEYLQDGITQYKFKKLKMDFQPTSTLNIGMASYL